MRLKCIKVKTDTKDSMLYHGLTVGKYYNIIDKDEIGYKIVNYLGWCVKDYFESVDEMRNNKLKEIGI